MLWRIFRRMTGTSSYFLALRGRSGVRLRLDLLLCRPENDISCNPSSVHSRRTQRDVWFTLGAFSFDAFMVPVHRPSVVNLIAPVKSQRGRRKLVASNSFLRTRGDGIGNCGALLQPYLYVLMSLSKTSAEH